MTISRRFFSRPVAGLSLLAFLASVDAELAAVRDLMEGR